MKTPNFIVRVPEPCHEDWNSMQPDAKGKFCNSCSKSVFDFSTKTDTEIKDILIEYKDQKVCGHFKKSQVNRPLSIQINLKDLPKNISMTKAFAIALFLVFGTFLFSCTDEHGQKVNEIKVNETEVVDTQNFTAGLVMPDFPIPQIDSISAVCTTVSGETMISTGFSYIESDHIDGGISIEEIPTEDITRVKEDTAVTKIEHYVLGQMISPYVEKKSSPVHIMDTVNLEEVTIVDYLEPLIDTETTSCRVMSTTGLVSICVIQPDSTVDDDVNKTINFNREFNVYPNPSSGEFTVKYLVKKRANVLLEIYDLKGVLIKTLVDVSNQYEGKYQIPVNLSELPNGIYLVSLINNGKKSVERLVIER